MRSKLAFGVIALLAGALVLPGREALARGGGFHGGFGGFRGGGFNHFASGFHGGRFDRRGRLGRGFGYYGFYGVLVAELAPLMAKRGKGAIVNLSTMVAGYGAAGMSLYGSSKAAINLLTKVWAVEYGPSGVRVNAVSPGPTRTEGTEVMGEDLERLAAEAPARRPATADEIAEAIVFLATDHASFIHGAKLAVDGGRTAV